MHINDSNALSTRKDGGVGDWRRDQRGHRSRPLHAARRRELGRMPLNSGMRWPDFLLPPPKKLISCMSGWAPSFSRAAQAEMTLIFCSLRSLSKGDPNATIRRDGGKNQRSRTNRGNGTLPVDKDASYSESPLLSGVTSIICEDSIKNGPQRRMRIQETKGNECIILRCAAQLKCNKNRAKTISKW